MLSADVSPVVATLLVAGAVVLIGSLIFIGVRQRSELEIPPRLPSWRPLALTPGQRRLRLTMFFLAQGWLLVGVIAAGFAIHWLMVVALSFFGATYVIRIAITIRWVVRARHTRADV